MAARSLKKIRNFCPLFHAGCDIHDLCILEKNGWYRPVRCHYWSGAGKRARGHNHESATFDPPNASGRLVRDDGDYWEGSRFTIDQAENVTDVGGDLVGFFSDPVNDTIFAALVQIAGPNSPPSGGPNEFRPLAEASSVLPLTQTDVRAALPAGVGSYFIGVTGSDSWENRDIAARFVVDGNVAVGSAPEPATRMMLVGAGA